jgi:membrane-bound metal-dependent hydrolase YbcI (DUF457 family)
MSVVLPILLRCACGGALVVVFSLLAQPLKPRTFSGVFGAAPSIAIAGLVVTAAFDGGDHAAAYAAGMIVGAVALVGYCIADAMLTRRLGALRASATNASVWSAIAVGGYFVAFR